MRSDSAACPQRCPRSRWRDPLRGRKRTILVIASLLAVGACGGGGGVYQNPRGPNDPPPGIQGQAVLVDSDLGQIGEQEPNDSRAQAYRLPPVGARTQVEVSGEIGVTAGWFGLADPVDVFRFTCLADQDVRLILDHHPEDPLGAGDNVVVAAVYESEGDALLGQTAGATLPHTTTVHARAGVPLDVLVTCTNGHTPWVLRFECSASTSALTSGAASVATSVATRSLLGDAGAACSGDVCSATRLLVRLRPGADAAAIALRYGMEIEGRTGSGSLRLRLPQGREAAAGAQKMQALSGQIDDDPDVAWAEPDWRVRPCGTVDDPELGRQWNLRAIGAQAAWDITMGDPSIVVGVIDTGIVDHPDLAGQVVDGYDFVSDPLIGADGDIGRDPDPTDPGDLGYATGLSSWHGTHVASILAARANDGYGVSGVAPGCRIMPLRALGVGGGLVSDVADAILYAAGLLRTEDRHQLTEPLRIVNLSLGLDAPSAELEEACRLAQAQGVLLVAAAGNDGQRRALYPARYDSVVAVAAVDASVNTTAYSNFGNDIDLTAPGGVVTRDRPGDGWPDGVLGAVVDDTIHPFGFAHRYLEGTSQAAPHVAAAAALLLSAEPTLTLNDLRRYLFFSAIDRGTPGRDDVYGRGVLQAHEALKLMLSEAGTPHLAPPELLLANQTVEFHGFETWHEVVVMNGGGGTLELQDPVATTDSGVNWLGASNELLKGAGPCNVVKMIITANRTQLPDEPGVYGGTVFVRDLDRTVGTLRVVMHVRQRLEAGLRHSVVARDAATGGVFARGVASPALGYRYWFPDLLSGNYKMMAGTDLDGDGFFCEGGDACGWYGGLSEAQAEVLYLGGDQTILGANVYLR